MPRKYLDNGTTLSYCEDYEYTDGEILYSLNRMVFQKSCHPSTDNAGNWYSFSAVAISDSVFDKNRPDSVCPKGWQLVAGIATDNKTYRSLLISNYNSGNNDSIIRFQPLSFVRSGSYNRSTIYDRAVQGEYRTSTPNSDGNIAHRLVFSANNLNADKNSGYSGNMMGYAVRCVAR